MLIPAPFDLVPYLLQGVAVTVKLLIASSALALIMSFLIGYGRLSRYRIISVPATVYSNSSEDPLLVQLLGILRAAVFGITLSAMTTGIIVIGLTTALMIGDRTQFTEFPRPKLRRDCLKHDPFSNKLPGNTPSGPGYHVAVIWQPAIELLKGTARLMITLNDLMFQGTVLGILR